jgi:hypothetical protein
VVGALVVVGALGGILWSVLVDPAVLTKSRDGAAMGEVELSRRFAVDGWYSVIAIVAGFLSGLGLTWWRSRDFRLTVVVLVLGAVAAAWVMATVGAALGPEDPEAVLAEAERGARAPVALAVSAVPFYLMWPVAALAGSLMVLWSSPGVDLSREPVPGPMPDRDRGVGENAAPTER